MATATKEKSKMEPVSPAEDVDPLAEIPFKQEKLVLARMKTDKYQRKLKPKFLRKMRNNFRPGLVGTLTISRRRSGDEVIIDGRHRWTILTERGTEEWACIVYEGLTLQEEALLFRDLQRERQGVLSYEVFEAELVGEDEDAQTLDAAVRSVGYSIGAKGSAPDAISAVAALRACYKRGRSLTERGELSDPLVNMERTLVIYRQAWQDRHVPTGWQIRGMHDLLIKTPAIDDERMVRRLKLLNPIELGQRATYAQQSAGATSTATKYMVEALEKLYAQREQAVAKTAVPA